MGKVHGSLARAGKVKSQTPKVRYQYMRNGVGKGAMYHLAAEVQAFRLTTGTQMWDGACKSAVEVNAWLENDMLTRLVF
jgi:Ribosomal protein S30